MNINLSLNKLNIKFQSTRTEYIHPIIIFYRPVWPFWRILFYYIV